MKSARVVNKILLNQYTTMDCAECGNAPCAPVHIVAAEYGGPDLEDNLIPLCKSCHSVLVECGWIHFLAFSVYAARYLQRKGWLFDDSGFKNFQ